MIGALWSLTRRSDYRGEVSLFFPGVQSQMFSNLTKALRARPDDGLDMPENIKGDSEVAPLALVIFESRAAAEFSLKQQGEPSTHRWGSGEPVEEFSRSLQVELQEPSTVKIRVVARSSEACRKKIQGLLDYYQEFVSTHPLSRVRRTRERTEARLAKNAAHLRALEEKMSRSSSRELRKLGDAAIRANPAVMSQLWLRRMEDEGRSRELLNQMQKIRGQVKGPKPAEAAWMKEWARRQRANPKTSPALKRAVGRQELLEQARLERDYDEALLRHRSLVLQSSFLLTLEDLDDFSYEVIDPIRIVAQRQGRIWYLFAGGVLGLLIGLAVKIRFYRGRNPEQPLEGP